MKRILICEDVNNGMLINNNFNMWNKIKTKEEHKQWEEDTASLLFGTYKNNTIIETIEKFNPKKGYILDSYMNEVNRALIANSFNIHK